MKYPKLPIPIWRMGSGFLTQSSTTSTFAPNPVSLTFGRYRLLNDRAGGMAEVFRAVALGPENFQRTLVINGTRTCRKIAFVQMFIDEAKVSGLLSHPNLVQIFEFGKVDESFFIAMEHVHGRTLAATQKAISQQNRVMPVPAATEIARQLCMVSNAIRCGRPTDRCWASCIGTSRNLMLSFHGTVKIPRSTIDRTSFRWGPSCTRCWRDAACSVPIRTFAPVA